MLLYFSRYNRLVLLYFIEMCCYRVGFLFFICLFIFIFKCFRAVEIKTDFMNVTLIDTHFISFTDIFITYKCFVVRSLRKQFNWHVKEQDRPCIKSTITKPQLARDFSDRETCNTTWFWSNMLIMQLNRLYVGWRFFLRVLCVCVCV